MSRMKDMGETDTELAEFCAEARRTVSHPFYFAGECAIWISSLMTIVSAIFIVIRFRKKFYFHINAKMLYIVLMIYCLAYSTTSLTSLTIHIYSLITLKNDCDVVFYSDFCSPFRRVSMTSFFGIFFVQIAFLIERSAALKKGSRYENEGCFWGCILTPAVICIPIFLMFWVMSSDDPTERNTFCIAATSSKSIGDKYFSLHYMLLGGDIAMLAYFGYLWKWNKRGIKIYSESSLGTKFQTQENLDVLRGVAPLILINTILVSLYVIMLTIVRFVKPHIELMTYKLLLMSIFVIPYYSFIMVMGIYWSLRQQAKKRKSQLQSLKINSAEKADTYFKSYAQNW